MQIGGGAGSVQQVCCVGVCCVYVQQSKGVYMMLFRRSRAVLVSIRLILGNRDLSAEDKLRLIEDELNHAGV